MRSKRLLSSLLALLLAALPLAASNVTGTITTATGSAVSNGTLTFTLNQAGIQPGVFNVISSPVACYTSTDGAVVGVPNPLVAPSVTGSTASGTVPAGTYYVRMTYVTFDAMAAVETETLVSPATVIVLGAPGRFDFTGPTLQPASAEGYRVYAGTTSGSEKLQATITGFGSTQITSFNGAAADDPSSNDTVCSLIFNDSIIPSYTFYRVALTGSNGAALPGFPQNWYLAGASIDVSAQYPVAAVAQQVRFPTPILSNPSTNAQQSVNSPLTLNGYSLTAGSILTQTLNNVRFCDQFSGANYGEKIVACIADIPSTGGVADARGLEGAQSITTDIFSGITKPVTLLLSVGTTTISANLTVPSNISLVFEAGSIWAPASATTTTINGEIRATTSTQHFSGAGTLTLARQREVLIEWFGGIGDDSTDNAAAFTAAYAALPADGGVIRLLTGTYEVDSAVSFATNGKRLLIIGAPGNATTIEFTAASGTLFTFNYGNNQAAGCCTQGHGLRDLFLKGPGIPTSAKGLVFGGSNGALGFSAYDFNIQGFDVGIEMGDNTWHNVFRRGMMRANDQHVVLPQAATEGGQPLLFEDVQFATRSDAGGAPAPASSVWIKGSNQEVQFINCDFGVQLHIGDSTSTHAQVSLINPHFENATNEDNYDFIRMDNHDANYLRISNGYLVQAKSSSPPAQFATFSGGKVSIFGFGMFSNAPMTNFAVLANAVGLEIFGFNELSGSMTGNLLGGSTTGWVVNFSGANTANVTPRNYTLGDEVGGAPFDVTGTIRTNETLRSAQQVYPGDASQNPSVFQAAAGLFAGAGAPNNSTGNNGDYYFRSDGTGDAIIYQKRSGAWAGIYGSLQTSNLYGTYAPTLTASVNVDSVTQVGDFSYSRVGNIVTVTGQLNVDPNAGAGTATAVGVSLPIASALDQAYHGNGVASISTQDGGKLAADAANDRMQMTFFAQSTASEVWMVVFQYQIF